MHNCIYRLPYLVLCYESLAYQYHNIEGLAMTASLENNTVKTMIPIVIHMSVNISANSLADIRRSSSRHRKHPVQLPNPSQIHGNQHVTDIYSIVFLDQSVHNPIAVQRVYVGCLWFGFQCMEPVKLISKWLNTPEDADK